MNYKKNTTNVKVDIERVSKELQIFLIDRNRGCQKLRTMVKLEGDNSKSKQRERWNAVDADKKRVPHDIKRLATHKKETVANETNEQGLGIKARVQEISRK